MTKKMLLVDVPLHDWRSGRENIGILGPVDVSPYMWRRGRKEVMRMPGPADVLVTWSGRKPNV